MLRKGFVEAEDAAVQRAYLELFPPTEAMPELREPLTRLAASKPDVRFKAIQAIVKSVFRENSIELDQWASDPRTTGALIDGLADSDTKVLEKLADVLRLILKRHLADLRAFDPLLPLLSHPSKKVRAGAVMGIGELAHEDRWRVLLPLFEDKSVDVRRELVRQVVLKGTSGSIPSSLKPKYKEALRKLLDDDDKTTSQMADTALKHLE